MLESFCWLLTSGWCTGAERRQVLGSRKTHSLRQLFLAALAVGAAVLAASQVSADPLYGAIVAVEGAHDGVFGSTSPVTASLDFSVPNVITAKGSAVATDGHLGAALGVSSEPCCFERVMTSYTFDVTFTATQSTALTSIPVALNLGIAGTLAGTGSFNTDWTVNVEFDHTFNASIQSDIEGASHHHTQSGIRLTSGSETLVDGSDSVSGLLTTDFVDLPLNVAIPIVIQLNLEGFANPGTYTDKFLDSLDFPIGSDVFTLPTGFTVNDPNGIIVNDRFGPAVPEPSTWALMLLGFVGLGFAGHSQARHRRAIAV